MSTITVCYRNNFRLGSSKKYAVLSFKDDGIKILSDFTAIKSMIIMLIK